MLNKLVKRLKAFILEKGQKVSQLNIKRWKCTILFIVKDRK